MRDTKRGYKMTKRLFLVYGFGANVAFALESYDKIYV